MSAIFAEKLAELRYDLLLHSPYLPDLAPSDYFLFPNLKKWLGRKRFQTNEEVMAETNAYFAKLPKDYFLDDLKKLETRWAKYEELKGDYVENRPRNWIRSNTNKIIQY